jgi:hypothetical protein
MFQYAGDYIGSFEFALVLCYATGLLAIYWIRKRSISVYSLPFAILIRI